MNHFQWHVSLTDYLCVFPVSRCSTSGWRRCVRARTSWRSGTTPGPSCAAPGGCRSNVNSGRTELPCQLVTCCYLDNQGWWSQNLNGLCCVNIVSMVIFCYLLCNFLALFTFNAFLILVYENNINES